MASVPCRDTADGHGGGDNQKTVLRQGLKLSREMFVSP